MTGMGEPRVTIAQEAGRNPAETSYRWQCHDCGEYGGWAGDKAKAEDGRYWHVRDHQGYVDILDG